MSEHEREVYLKLNPMQNIRNKDLTFCSASCGHIEVSIIGLIYINLKVSIIYIFPSLCTSVNHGRLTYIYVISIIVPYSVESSNSSIVQIVKKVYL